MSQEEIYPERQALISTPVLIDAPAPVTNCPDCSLWLPPGTLACPDCHAIIYARHLNQLAQTATAQEQASEWGAARQTWQQALNWLPQGTKQSQAIGAHLEQLDAQAKATNDQKAKWTKRLGPLAPIVFFLLKAKSLLFSAKFFFSFLAFFGFYWAIFGWRFGLGFAVGILIHEFGHYITARRLGLKVDLPIFLPGLGAYVRWYQQGTSFETLAQIALAGPLYGGTVALVCLGVGIKFGSGLFLALAYTTAFLNTLNLVPILGLDGSQATYTLNRMQRGMIAVTCVLVFAVLHNWAYLELREWMFLVIAAAMVWRTFTGIAPEQPSSRGMAVYTLLLFGLAAIMGVSVYMSRMGLGIYPH